MESSKLAKSIEDLFFVYAELDPTEILTRRFPNRETFYEKKIQDINYSFLKFLDANPELEDSKKTDLQAEFKSGNYGSIYDLYHDIKLACIAEILQHENDTLLYSKIDNFYKVCVEILLREAIRLGVSLKAEQEVENTDSSGTKTGEKDQEDQIKSQLSQLKPVESVENLSVILERDFEMITSTFYNSIGKSLSIFASGNIPFFSSLNNYKSDLDDREPVIDPALGVTITNVIPNISMISDDNLSKFSDSNIKIPNIRQILENYMHPNWLRLISSQWLKHGSGLTSLNFSFAPTYDETQSIISNDWKGLTWCQQIGFKKLVEEKKKYAQLLSKSLESTSGDLDTVKKVDAESQVSITPTPDETSKSVDEISPIEVPESNGNLEAAENDSASNEQNDEKIDLKNVLLYDVNKLVSEDEVKAVKSNNVQPYISDLLTDLNQLRQDRIERQKKHARYNKNILGTGSRIFKPSNDEIKLFNKIRRLLTGLIEAKDIKPVDLNIDIDKKIPVLQHNYQGTLPALYGVSNQKTTKSKRRK